MESDLSPNELVWRLLWVALKLALVLAVITPDQPFIYQGF